MEQRCLQPLCQSNSANLDSDANHMYRKLRWKLQYVQQKNSFIVMLHPIEVLHEASTKGIPWEM
jgi:hypothetical protein